MEGRCGGSRGVVQDRDEPELGRVLLARGRVLPDGGLRQGAAAGQKGRRADGQAATKSWLGMLSRALSAERRVQGGDPAAAAAGRRSLPKRRRIGCSSRPSTGRWRTIRTRSRSCSSRTAPGSSPRTPRCAGSRTCLLFNDVPYRGAQVLEAAHREEDREPRRQALREARELLDRGRRVRQVDSAAAARRRAGAHAATCSSASARCRCSARIGPRRRPRSSAASSKGPAQGCAATRSCCIGIVLFNQKKLARGAALLRARPRSRRSTGRWRDSYLQPSRRRLDRNDHFSRNFA